MKPGSAIFRRMWRQRWTTREVEYPDAITRRDRARLFHRLNRLSHKEAVADSSQHEQEGTKQKYVGEGARCIKNNTRDDRGAGRAEEAAEVLDGTQ